MRIGTGPRLHLEPRAASSEGPSGRPGAAQNVQTGVLVPNPLDAVYWNPTILSDLRSS